MGLHAEAGEDAAAAAAPPPERAPTFERLVWEEARRLLAAIGDWGSRPRDELLARLSALRCNADDATVVAVCMALLTSPSMWRMVLKGVCACSRAALVTVKYCVLTDVSRGTEEGVPALTGA